MRMAVWGCGASVNPSNPEPSESARQRGPKGEGSALLMLSLAERLIVDAQQQFNKIPRSQRYRYGARLEDAFYLLPDLILQAASARTKTKVYALCDHLRLLGALLRIGAEARYIGSRWLARISRPPSESDAGGELSQIGAMAFAWRARIKVQ